MAKWKSTIQSQIPNTSRTNTGDMEMEDIGSPPEISEKIADAVNNQIHEDIEEIRSEIISQAKKKWQTFEEVAQHSQRSHRLKKDRSMGKWWKSWMNMAGK